MESPNFGPRKGGALPSLIVLHYTAMANWRAARDWLCNPQAEVSAHYLLSEVGDICQLVAEDQRAWHAGAGRWGAIDDVNSHSIGIEINNSGQAPFAAKQMDALEKLLPQIMKRWAIPPERVIAHSDLAPGRKIDPGSKFDWARLARRGLAVAPSRDLAARSLPTASWSLFRADAAAFGYTADVPEDVLLFTFRLRHRAGYSGPLDGMDCAIAADLARRFPIAQFGLTA